VTGEGGAYQLVDGLTPGVTYQVRASASGHLDNFVSVVVESGVVRQADIGLAVPEPLLAVEPLTLEFGDDLLLRSFQVRNDGPAGTHLHWEAVAPFPWIASVTPESGMLAAGDPAQTVTVVVERSVLADEIGVHSGLCTVASDGGVELVDLRLQIPDPDAPHLDYAYEIVEFGAVDTARQVTLHNDGTAELSWSVEEDLGWLAVGPTAGALLPGASAALTLTADRTGLAAGSEHAGYLRFSSNSTVDDAIPLRVHLAVPHHYAWQVGPASFDLGLDRVDGKLTLENRSSDTLAWTSESSAAWLRAVPAAGQIAVGDTVPAYVLVDRALAGTGTFSGQVTFRSAGGEVVISVSGEEIPQPGVVGWGPGRVD